MKCKVVSQPVQLKVENSRSRVHGMSGPGTSLSSSRPPVEDLERYELEPRRVPPTTSAGLEQVPRSELECRPRFCRLQPPELNSTRFGYILTMERPQTSYCRMQCSRTHEIWSPIPFNSAERDFAKGYGEIPPTNFHGMGLVSERTEEYKRLPSESSVKSKS